VHNVHNVSAAAIQLETLKLIKQLQQKKDSATGSDTGSSSSAGGLISSKDVAAKFRGMRKLKHRWKKHSASIIRQYLLNAREKVGAEDGFKAWKLTDLSWRLQSQFTRSRGLWRAHYYLQEALSLCTIQDKPLQGIALLVQLSKAIHQTALDGNVWTNSALLIPVKDPLATDEFGGSYEELSAVASYRSALRDLKSQHQKAAEEPSSSSTAPAPTSGANAWENLSAKAKSKAKGRAAAKGKGKDKDATGEREDT